jgi:hypothetical protein
MGTHLKAISHSNVIKSILSQSYNVLTQLLKEALPVELISLH